MLRLDEGPLAHMIRLARDIGPMGQDTREQALRDFLGNFRFVGEMVHQAVGSLSGGEKARLVLAMLVWQRPNLLLLDEPTNHLDLQTREALSMALNEYEGTVMLVSHDRALLREVCDEFWLVAGGAVKPFDGDLDDYQQWLLEQSREAARAAKAARAGGEPTAPRAAPFPCARRRHPPRQQTRRPQARGRLRARSAPTTPSHRRPSSPSWTDCGAWPRRSRFAIALAPAPRAPVPTRRSQPNAPNWAAKALATGRRIETLRATTRDRSGRRARKLGTDGLEALGRRVTVLRAGHSLTAHNRSHPLNIRHKGATHGHRESPLHRACHVHRWPHRQHRIFGRQDQAAVVDTERARRRQRPRHRIRSNSSRPATRPASSAR